MTWNWGSERELSWQKSDIESDCGSNLFCRVEPRLRRWWRKPSSLHHCIQKALSSIRVFLQVMNNLVSSHWFNPVTALLGEGMVGICEAGFIGGDVLGVLWEALSAAWNHNLAIWQAPPCTSFFFTFDPAVCCGSAAWLLLEQLQNIYPHWVYF